MRIGFKHVGLAAAAAAVSVGAALAAPMAAADQVKDVRPAQTPAPAPSTVTVTVMAPTPGPQDNQGCTSSASSTKCVKGGDAEINAAIPAPYPGPFGIYGPFFGG